MKRDALVVLIVASVIPLASCERVDDRNIRNNRQNGELLETEDTAGDWIVTDKRTGCQYIESERGSGITPRLGVPCNKTGYNAGEPVVPR